MKYEINTYKGYELGSLPKDSIKELEELSRISATEGIVMLENKNDTLPLKKGDRVSVFGRIQREYYKSGTGSGGLVNVKYVTNIVDSLKECDGIEINEELLNTYEEWKKDHPFDYGKGWGQEPWCQEEMELDMSLVEDARKFGDKAIIVIGRTAGEDKDNSATQGSYLLTEKEEDMIKKVTSVFEKTIVLLNVGAIIDMKWVEKYKPASVLYLWQGGMCGGLACADILTGKVNPSGKLADTIAYDIKDYPSTDNFGEKIGSYYKEDIYVGYRYFETVAKDKVLYPFGFGLSYTNFEISADVCVNDGKIKVDATVKNVGGVSGKETVQIYFGAPNGKLGKSARELVAYKKTRLLEPNEQQTLTLEFDIDKMCAYDDGGVTGNKSCYVLEAGDYEIYVGSDVRSAQKAFTYTQGELKIVQKCTEALSPIKMLERVKHDGNGKLQREQAPTRTYAIKDRVEKNLPKEIPYTGNKGIKLDDVREGKATMDDFVAQLNDEELCCLVRGEGMNSPKVTPGTGSCFGGVTDELISYGIPIVCTTDGPSGIRMDSGLLATSMPNGTCLACTFNTELISELYALEGVEMTAYEIDVILGPGINIHRSPLNGRNFEYFSEDPYLAGTMASAISKGLANAGVYCTIKHFMANSQEWYRHHTDAIISERAIREIYARPFEIAVKEGGVKAIMTAYNCINGAHAASCYDLTKTLLRDEWKYDGFVMTDWWAKLSDLDGKESNDDFASMVKCVNDVYMVMPNAKNNKDNLPRALESGYLKRAELQACAKNICGFVMYTHAYERFKANGFKYEITDLDTSSMSVCYEIGRTELGAPTELRIEKSGKYVLEIEFESSLSELAQISIGVNVDGSDACTAVAKGTNGEKGSIKTPISMMNWNKKITFTSKADVKIISAKFLI
ncbi:MAG: glycoside hydrolase family 3 protein [Clostridia bacterium]|nr:glycoside hydrolase family 3 protein [Clostridia bacterium]